jgi:hypothetical protein
LGLELIRQQPIIFSREQLFIAQDGMESIPPTPFFYGRLKMRPNNTGAVFSFESYYFHVLIEF